jgi:carboxymethylenebutenolidase
MQSVRCNESRQWRCVLVLWAAILLFQPGAEPVRAGEIEKQAVTVDGRDGPISITLFAAGDPGRRPAAIILHGRLPNDAAYTRYAEQLVLHGMNALLVSYYNAADSAAMAADRNTRAAYFRAHLATWSERVRDVVSYALARSDASGRVGLLGFSNGGFLAVASAAADPRVGALVVFYGGIARAGEAEIAHLPPLLALHGDADRVIPPSQGAALVEKARALGGQADLIIYPGAGHGFDFDAARPDSRDASDRALSFLARELIPAR